MQGPRGITHRESRARRSRSALTAALISRSAGRPTLPSENRARAFYSDVLGFPVREVGESHLVFGHGGADLVASACEWAGAVGEYSREGRAVFVFGVPSVEGAMEALRARGVEFLHNVPAEGPLGRYTAFVDPFGIVHEVQEPRAA